MINTEIVPTDENQMRMCCWEFCVFVLFQAGLVSSEKIARLLTFIPNRIKALPDALVQRPFSQYREVTVDHPAQPGDLLLFVRNRDCYPWHAAICLKDHTHIELMCSWTDKGRYYSVKQLETRFYNEEKIYCVPVDEAVQNIDRLLEANAHLSFDDLPQEMPENEFINTIRNSQYRKLIKKYTVRG